MFGVTPAGIVTIESNGLIADDPNGTVARGGIDPVGIHVRFGTGDKEGAGQMQPMEPDEIDIAAIHHVDGARFREEQIERVDIVQLAVREWMKLGMLPRKSSRVCIFTAALVERKCAQGKTDRHRSMVVESSA